MDRDPMTNRRSAARLSAAAILVAVIAMTTGCTPTTDGPTDISDAVVEAAPTTADGILAAFYEAIQDGDAERALELIPPLDQDGDFPASDALLTDDILGTSTGITDVVVPAPEFDADSGLFQMIVEYTLDGAPQTKYVYANPTPAGFDFYLAYKIEQLPFTDVDTLLVGGQKVLATQSADDTHHFFVFPGSFTVETPDDSSVTLTPTSVDYTGATPEWDFAGLPE